MVIKVVNLDKCIIKMDAIGKVDMEPYIQKATQLVQNTAKDLAPNRTGITPSGRVSKSTGHLRRNIFRETIRKGNGVIGRVYNPVEYAWYVEAGTSRMVPQPFLYPALEKNSQEIERGAQSYIKAYLAKFKK